MLVVCDPQGNFSEDAEFPEDAERNYTSVSSALREF
jgi:hypothetical protein